MRRYVHRAALAKARTGRRVSTDTEAASDKSDFPVRCYHEHVPGVEDMVTIMRVEEEGEIRPYKYSQGGMVRKYNLKWGIH